MSCFQVQEGDRYLGDLITHMGEEAALRAAFRKFRREIKNRDRVRLTQITGHRIRESKTIGEDEFQISEDVQTRVIYLTHIWWDGEREEMGQYFNVREARLAMDATLAEFRGEVIVFGARLAAPGGTDFETSVTATNKKEAYEALAREYPQCKILEVT